MFSKYVSKITNTIGTINYLQQKSRQNYEQQVYLQNSSEQHLRDDGSVVLNDGKEMNNNFINNDLSSKRSQIPIDDFAIESDNILTAAIAKLRHTLFAYELVWIASDQFRFYRMR